MGLASFILGLICLGGSVTLFWNGFAAFMVLICGVAGIILGFLAVKKGSKAALGRIGIILSAIGICLDILLWAGCVLLTVSGGMVLSQIQADRFAQEHGIPAGAIPSPMSELSDTLGQIVRNIGDLFRSFLYYTSR